MDKYNFFQIILNYFAMDKKLKLINIFLILYLILRIIIKKIINKY